METDNSIVGFLTLPLLMQHSAHAQNSTLASSTLSDVPETRDCLC
jgi:hypothetical protein